MPTIVAPGLAKRPAGPAKRLQAAEGLRNLVVRTDVPHRRDAQLRHFLDLDSHRPASGISGNELRHGAVADVQPTGRWYLGSSVRSLPEAGRRGAIPDAKRPCERLVCFVAGVERDLRDRPVVGQHLPRRPLHPQPPDQLERRLADHAAEHAVKVERRHAAPDASVSKSSAWSRCWRQ
jgi:hypothetical protein